MLTYDLEDIFEIRVLKGLHKKGNPHATAVQAEKDIDPVCGMEINESKAGRQLEYLGDRYFFCTSACKTAFERNPEKYTRLLRFARNDW